METPYDVIVPNLQERILQAQHDSAILQSTIDEIAARLKKQEIDEDKLKLLLKSDRVKQSFQQFEQGVNARAQFQQSMLDIVDQEQRSFLREIQSGLLYHGGKFDGLQEQLRQTAQECRTIVESHIISYNDRVVEILSITPEMAQRIRMVKKTIKDLIEDLQEFRNSLITKTYERLPWEEYVYQFMQRKLKQIENSYDQLEQEAEERQQAAEERLNLVYKQQEQFNQQRAELTNIYKQKVAIIRKNLKSIVNKVNKEAGKMQLRLYTSGSRITRYSSLDVDDN